MSALDAPRTKVLGDDRGAVYVEFLVAFLPLLVFFLSLFQIALLFATRLMIDHAAVCAARAAAVVVAEKPQGSFADEPPHRLGPGRRQTVKDAALIALAPLIVDGSIDTVSVQFPDPVRGGNDRREPSYPAMTGAGGAVPMMRVRLRVEVVCKIALVNRMACRNRRQVLPWVPILTRGKPTMTMSAEAIYPYQGAAYAYGS